VAADMIDVAFALQGGALASEHRFALAAALERALPWLPSEPAAGVHRLRLVGGEDGGEALVSPRTRLVLRVPRQRADATASLAGVRLQVGAHALTPAQPRPRELLPYGTLYAALVAADAADEAGFVARMRAELDALEVPAQAVCGRWQATEGGRLVGCSLMVTGLDRAQSLRLLQHGLGAHRRLGCGLFVAHKSAAAVGAPD
jgi:CRISPR-associated protein Cas6